MTLNLAWLVGGTLKAASGGVIITVGVDSILDGSDPTAPLANAGSIAVADATALQLVGTINNRDNGSSGTFLRSGSGGAALQGGGKVTLTDSANNLIDQQLLVGSGMTLRNLDNTIAGAGNIGNGNVSLVNAAKGVINATGANNFLIIDSFNLVLNSGLMEATGAAGMKVVDDLINAGTLKAAASGTLLEIHGALTNRRENQ